VFGAAPDQNDRCAGSRTEPQRTFSADAFRAARDQHDIAIGQSIVRGEFGRFQRKARLVTQAVSANTHFAEFVYAGHQFTRNIVAFHARQTLYRHDRFERQRTRESCDSGARMADRQIQDILRPCHPAGSEQIAGRSFIRVRTQPDQQTIGGLRAIECQGQGAFVVAALNDRSSPANCPIIVLRYSRRRGPSNRESSHPSPDARCARPSGAWCIFNTRYSDLIMKRLQMHGPSIFIFPCQDERVHDGERVVDAGGIKLLTSVHIDNARPPMP